MLPQCQLCPCQPSPPDPLCTQGDLSEPSGPAPAISGKLCLILSNPSGSGMCHCDTCVPLLHLGGSSTAQATDSSESQKVWVGGDDVVPVPCHGTPSTIPGCSKLRPTWPQTIPGMGQPQFPRITGFHQAGGAEPFVSCPEQHLSPPRASAVPGFHSTPELQPGPPRVPPGRCCGLWCHLLIHHPRGPCPSPPWPHLAVSLPVTWWSSPNLLAHPAPASPLGRCPALPHSRLLLSLSCCILPMSGPAPEPHGGGCREHCLVSHILGICLLPGDRLFPSPHSPC